VRSVTTRSVSVNGDAHSDPQSCDFDPFVASLDSKRITVSTGGCHTNDGAAHSNAKAHFYHNTYSYCI